MSKLPPDGRAETSSNAKTAKAELRRTLIAARSAASQDDRHRADAARNRSLRRMIDAVDAGRGGAATTVAVYLSRPPEPDTIALVADLHRAGFRMLVPSPGPASSWTQPAWAWFSGELVAGPSGIPVTTGPSLGPDVLALAQIVILPGLAGSRDGTRLGSGAGWYDRALLSARSDAQRWLVLNDDELIDDLPSQTHDVAVDKLVLPYQTIDCRR